MTLQTYRYSGPVSGAAIHHNGRVLDVRLHPGKTVQLPEAHEYTKTLLGLGYLTQASAPVPPESPPPPPVDSAAESEKPRGKKGISQ